MTTARKVASPLDRFARATAAVPRIIGASAGEVGTGKSDFWLGGPAPVVYFDLNRGLEGVADRYLAQDKDVRILHYDWEPIGALDGNGTHLKQADAVALRDAFVSDYEFACTHARTVVVDETEAWELFRYAEFGEPSDRPNNYAALNQRYRKFVNYAKKHTCNVGFIQGLKDEWVSVTKASGAKGGEFSGNRKMAGWKELTGMVNCELWHERKGGQFEVTIGKVRGQSIFGLTDSTHQVFGAGGESTFDFKTLGMMMHPDTDLPDWS